MTVSPTSIGAGAAGSGELLILARVLQGIGGAMILPSTQSTLNANFQGRDRAIAFGIWGATIGGMAAVGPLLGGWLTTAFSWRWAFFVNVPIAAVAILGTLRFIGDIDEGLAREISYELEGVEARPFKLRLTGCGVFGGNKPHSLFVGVEESPELRRLQSIHERICQVNERSRALARKASLAAASSAAG